MGEASRSMAPTNAQKATISELFDRIDAINNQDGLASYQELQAVFGEYADEFLKYADKDDDKKLTKEEFTSAIFNDSEDMSEADFEEHWVERMTKSVRAAEMANDLKNVAETYEAQKEAEEDGIERMVVKIHGGEEGKLYFHSTAVPLAYGDKFTLVSSEPESDGGSGQGPNPMTYGIMSVPVCEHEESNMMAEGVGISDWAACQWACQMDINLAGYMGEIKTPMPAKDVFTKVFITCKPVGSTATDEQVQALKAKVHSTCPMARLFETAGIEFEETWVTADGQLPENSPAAEGVERMNTSVNSSGKFHSEVFDISDAPEGHVVTLAEPEEDGGSGKGPNPMEALILSLAICEFETSLMIAGDKGIKSWVLDMDAAATINLNGYMGKEDSLDLDGGKVFLKYEHGATIATEADQATIDAIFEEVKARCPLTRLFEDGGVKLEGTWTKA